jgi:hypothetical protein
MRLWIGRGATFFGVIAVICAILVPVTPSGFRWVAWGSAGLALFWAVVLALDEMATGRSKGGRARVPRGEPPAMPFEPPRPPGTSSRGSRKR